MSTSVDNRVVRMQFDNAQFEHNAQQSMSTMEKLKSLMNFESSVKGLDKINSASQNMRFDAIADGVESLTNRFSTLGIVGMTALQNIANSAFNAGKRLITAIPKQIMTGGWTRATNIENAKFQLEGLGVAWEKIQEDLDYGVKDTAYGLDEAAIVASQLVASQVEVGDAMKQSLRAVSGVAAMTNSSYGDIGRIFTTVAGQGRLMADQLNQIAARGVNAAAVLAKHLGVTEAEVREMTSKGKIDFATFAAAMDDAFGEHAKEANKTFNGAFSNMKAALNRIGADFAMPLRDNMRDIFNSITPVFNAVRKSLVPTVEWASKAMKTLSTIVVQFMGRAQQTITNTIKLVTDARKAMKDAGETVDNYIYGIFEVLGRLNIIPANTVAWFDRATKAVINGVQILTKYFMENETSVNNLKDTFKGLSSIFSIVSMGFSVFIERVARPLAIVLRTVLDVILAITGPLGRLATALERSFASFLRNKWWNNGFVDLFNPIADVCLWIDDLIEHFNDLTKAKISFPKIEGAENFLSLGNIVRSIGDFISALVESFKKVFNFVGLGDTLADVIRSVGEAFKELFSFDNIGNGFVKLLGSLGEGLAAFSNALKGSDFINLIVNGSLAVGLSNFLQSLANLFGSSTGIKLVAVEVKRALRDMSNSASIYLQAMANSVNANALMKLAIAIGILAVSFKLLSEIDSDKLASATAVMGLMMAGLAKMVSVLSSIKLGVMGIASIGPISNSLIKMAAAILILSFAVEKMGKLDLATLAKGLGGVAASMLIMVGAVKLIGKGSRGLKKTAGSMIVFAAALWVLASAVEKMGALPFNQLVKGLFAVGVAMLEVALFAKMLGKSKIKVSTAVSMIAIAAAMNIFADAVARFGTMDWEALGKGGAALAGILLSVAGFSQLAKGGGKMIAFGIAMILIATSMNILTKAVEKIANVEWENLGKAGAVLGGFMAFVTAASRLSAGAGKLLALGTSMILVSASLGILASALTKIANIPTDGLNNATMVMTLFMLFATGIMAASNLLDPVKMIASAGSILVLSIAMIALSTALSKLGKLSLKQVAIGLAAIAGALVIIGVAGVLLAGAVVPILAIAGAAALLSVAMLAMSSAVLALGSAAGVISVAVPSMLAGLGKGFVEFFKSIAESMKELAPALIAIIGGLSDVIIQSAPKIALAAMSIITALLDLLVQAVPQVVEAGMALIQGLIDGIANNIGGIVESAAAIVVNFINGIASAAGDIIQAGFNLVLSLIEGIASALSSSENQARVQNAMKDLISGLLSMGLAVITGGIGGFASAGEQLMNSGLVRGIASKIGQIKTKIVTGVRSAIRGAASLASEFFTVGVNFVKGLLNGIGSLASSLWNKGVELAKKLIGGAKAGTAEQSPSKEAFKIGKFFDQGLINGVVKLQDKVGETAESVGEHMVDSLGSALSSAGSIDETYAPTITPVFDMTNVTAGYDNLSSMFASDRAVTLGANISGQMDANNVVLDYISKLDAANASRNTSVLDKFDKLSDDILTLGERIENLELTLDGDKLVGGIAKRADRALGTRAILEKRGL